MYCPAVFCIGTWIFTGAAWASARKADFRALEFCPAFYGFGAVPAHSMPFTAYGDTVIAYGEIVLIDGRPAALAVEVNEWCNAVIAAEFIISHGIMGGIQQKFIYISLRQELHHRVPVIKEAEGIMPGSGAEEREDGKVVFRVRGGEHIQVIAEVEPPPVGIPSDVTVGLAVDTVTFTFPDSFFKAAAGALFAFLCSSVDRRAVTGNGKVHEVNEAVPVRFQEKKFFEYLEKAETWFHILRRFPFKFFKEFLDGIFFDRRCLFPFFLRLLGLFFRGMDFGREVVIIGKPESGLEIVKSAGSRGIADSKAGKDGVEMVFLKVGSPFCIGSDLELHGEEDGTEHVGRKPWLRAEIGIAVLHDDVDLREVKVPEFLHDLPGGSRKGMDSIRIVFTKLCQNTVLVGGMAANVNRFQFRNTPNQKVCTGCAGTKDTLLIKGAKRRTFCTVCQPLFLKSWGNL